MSGLISPSLMCVDMMNVERNIRALEDAGVDYLHIDVMDNHFVPNITLCPDFIRQVKAVTKLPLDVHLMIERPERSLHDYDCLDERDFCAIHWEATPHPQRAMAAIRAMGARPGVALNPATPLSALDYLLDDAEMVLLMTVNPGFAGQKLLPATLDKIKRARALLAEHGRERVIVAVDGNVSFENAKSMRAMGADLFVGGSSSVFRPGASVQENCAALRAVLA